MEPEETVFLIEEKNIKIKFSFMERFGVLFAKEASPLSMWKYNSWSLVIKSCKGAELEEWKPEEEAMGAGEETPRGGIQSAKTSNVLSFSYSSIESGN